MQPNQESDELSEILAEGYAAPPLNKAFSSDLVRQLQAEVVQQTIAPISRRVRWGVALSGVAIAASILTAIFVLNPMGPEPSRDDELAMQLVPRSIDEKIISLESMMEMSSVTESRQANAVGVDELETVAIPRETKPQNQKLSESKVSLSDSKFSTFESLAKSTLEQSLSHGSERTDEERQPGGSWPKDWPQGLEHLRAQASSEFRNTKHATVFRKIPFSERGAFEASWPGFLDLMKRKHFKFVLLSSRTGMADRFIGVAVLCPLQEVDVPNEQEVPEFGKTVVYLFVDGDVIDLNRIQLPADMPIIDERFKEPNKEAQ